MSKIKIKNFGPIKEGYLDNDGFMEIEKVTVFIGNQGSGKSTVAKVISTLMWLEKAINRGDIDPPKNFAQLKDLFNYQRINNYFREETVIEYHGESMQFLINSEKPYPLINHKTSNKYNVPKIMYVPSERNFLSVIENPFDVRNLPGTLNTFARELRNCQLTISRKLIDLPINGIKYLHDSATDTSYLIGDNYKLNLREASSGYQSLIPLFLVTKFLNDELQLDETVLREQLSPNQSIRRNKEIAEIIFNFTLNEKQKNKKVREIDARYLNTCLINIVEEPEQNLFPTSQRHILNSLLKFNNMSPGNKLIMTTHSPYLINYLTLAIKAESVDKNVNMTPESITKLNEIVPLDSMIKGDFVVIYEFNEINGTINKLDNYKGLPSDENYLNNGLEDSNELFAQLQEIEKGWR